MGTDPVLVASIKNLRSQTLQILVEPDDASPLFLGSGIVRLSPFEFLEVEEARIDRGQILTLQRKGLVQVRYDERDLDEISGSL